MNEFSTWIQSNWYALGNLLLQGAFLTAAIWFARDVLKNMRASQEQIGALLKLSMTGALTDRHSATDIERPFASASPYWLTPQEISPAPLPEPIENGPSRWAVALHSVTVWLQTPMSTGEVTPWRKAIKWLQAPARS
jgi:hypothetical protein